MRRGSRGGLIAGLMLGLAGAWLLAEREPLPRVKGAAAGPPVAAMEQAGAGGAAGDGRAVPGNSGATRTDSAEAAFRAQRSGSMVLTAGRVERLLSDDRDGSPHQRFIIRTDGGLSLLVAHNLDLAPRLDGLAAGERVAVLGQYEWNDKGGVLHWTHDDPQGRHAAGYVEWRGRRYQ